MTDTPTTAPAPAPEMAQASTAPAAAASAKKAGGGMIRSSMIYSALTLVSRFMGAARDLVITGRLGASQTIADAKNRIRADMKNI